MSFKKDLKLNLEKARKVSTKKMRKKLEKVQKQNEKLLNEPDYDPNIKVYFDV